MTVSSGDWDGDGRLDLAIGEPVRTGIGPGSTIIDFQRRGSVYLFRSIGDRLTGAPATLNLADADVIVRGEADLDLFGGLGATPSLDVDRDGIADLVIGAPFAGAFSGRVYVVYGSRPADPGALAHAATAIPLENFAVPGAGAFLAQNGIFGQGSEDIDGDGQPDFVLLPGQERWFRFTTLGDGQPGNQLLVAPGFETEQARLQRGADARFDPTPPADRGPMELGSRLALGSEVGDQVILEFDLSPYLDRREDPTAIQEARLSLETAVALPELATSPPATLVFVNNQIFFQGRPAGAFNEFDTELWRTDGTVLGTTLPRDINGGFFIAGSGLLPLGSSPQNLTPVGTTLFFAASDTTLGTATGTELWKTDGTTAGTVLVRDINAGAASSSPANLTNVNGTLFFTANDGINGVELFKSDGTTASLLRNINTGIGASSNPANLTAVGSTLFFAANDGVNGVELWKSDGTTTSLVRNINGAAGASSNPANLTAVGSTLFFTADDGTTGTELWKSDGTTAGTSILLNMNAAATGSNVGNLTNVNGILYFTANDGVHGVELWRTNGTLLGLARLATVNTGFNGLTNFSQLTAAGNALYFTAFQATTGVELWRYDVPTNTLRRLTDIAPGPVSSSPSELTVLGNTLFFAADAGARTTELWKTDGAVAGTVKVSAVPRGVSELTAADSRVFFTARDSSGALGVWLTDGTATGTKRLADAPLINRSLQIRVLDGEGDGAPTSLDATAAAGPAISRDLSTVSGILIDVDLTSVVRAALQAGKTRLTLRLGLDSPNPPSPVVLFSSTDLSHQTGLEIVTRQSTGVLADLYDAEGARLAAGQSIVDLLTLAAGTFYLRVYNPSVAGPTGAVSFTIEATPPIPGFSQPASDRDVIRGGDGDDILIGNEHLDRLFGERGTDLFVAEATEIGETLEVGESRRDPAIGEGTALSQRELRPSDAIVDAYFHDQGLRVAVARALGIPVTTSADGVPLVQEPIRASGMAGLTHLDLTGLGIADLRGLEFATNVRSLALAGNRVADLSPLAPATITSGQAIGSPVGLARLEHLSLDGNPVTDLSPLADLLELRSLSLDGQRHLASVPPPSNGALQIIGNPVPNALAQFGQVIAASGDYVVVSSPLQDTAFQDAGAVYVFGSTDGSLLRTIAQPQPQFGSHFGSSLAIDGNLLAVGTPTHDVGAATDAGAVYVFDLRTGALLSFLTKPGSLATGDNFGAAVALSGSTVVVGAPGDDSGATDTGSAFVFAARTGRFIQGLLNPTPLGSENFGSSLAVEADTLVVGAPGAVVSGVRAGEAYLFDLTTGTRIATMSNPAPLAFADFGRSVAISGDRVLIGAPGSVFLGVNPAAAYVYDSRTGLPVRTISDPTPSLPGFGAGVALRGDAALIGDVSTPLFGFNDGTAYLFDVSNGQLQRTLAAVPTPGGDGFGFSVALPGAAIIVGAPGEEHVYIHEGLGVSDTGPLAGLSKLRFISLSNQRLERVEPLLDLEPLRSLYLDGNRIADIGALVGQRTIDDGDPGFIASAGWMANIDPVSGTFQEDYRFIRSAGPLNPAPQTAEWAFLDLAPGAYAVLVTWPTSESRASDAQYSVFDGTATTPQMTATVNQKFAPGGNPLGGVAWQSLGEIGRA